MKTYEKKKQTNNGIKRLIFCCIAIILEIGFVVATVTTINKYTAAISIAIRVLAVILVLVIYSQEKTSTIKMTWIILISVVPVFGVILYLLLGLNKGPHKMRERYELIDSLLFPLLPKNQAVLDELKAVNPSAGSISHYISDKASYPVYTNTDIKYHSKALDGLNDIIDELKKAESFIFMEYHAIEDDKAWLRIQEVLELKVKSGVEVRVFYDDIGSISFINKDFVKSLEAVGIKCKVFNPFMPGINMFLNNRDHRKITVIDGKVAFTGGYNIANEYFNYVRPYGDWKDAGIKLIGDAVKSMTVTFLENWNADKKNISEDKDYSKYLPECHYQSYEHAFIQPYADNPIDNERTGENVYISIINKAEKYCWFMTPYLIITDEMINAMALASMRGVDVRIITPGIPDKKLVYQLTRSFYPTLAKKGIKIFEWTPGFCHAKLCISDDYIATCGTINLDYRSLYHNFENGVYMVNTLAIEKIHRDFINTFNESNEVTELYSLGDKSRLKFSQLILRLFTAFL